MLDWLLFGIAAAAGGVGGQAGGAANPPAPSASVAAKTPVAPSAPAPAPPPSGQYTTAAEVRPIMEATRGQWIAVREYDGQDIIYFTQLLSWRCGLSAIRYSVNGGPMQQYPLPPCHEDMAQPNVLLDNEAMPIMGLPPKSVQTVDVEVFYDDTGIDSASYRRNQVLIP
ncbi:hypothetical protein [Thalassovita sp.]|uniref:hypothetical protein n=1 Tax=Thalassovita sp. TaxID=1979401 RepID=UPI0029DE723A|nr:hypothetical protein [Thalassovita sp.]